MSALATVNHLSILLAGFSVFACLILLSAYLFFLPDMRKSASGKIACTVLLSCLALLQLAHYAYFKEHVSLLDFRAYGLILTLTPPSFYFFSRVVLFSDNQYGKIDLLHIAPLLLAAFIPIEWIPAMAFTFGSAYTLWFTRLVLQLRGQGKRFHFELFFFGMFAVMALGALMLGLALPSLDPHIFYSAYGNAISLAILLIVAALLFFPELLSDILLISELAYAKSKLNGIDTAAKLGQLSQLMTADKHFQNEDLSLSNVADSLELTTHQLSELINSHFGYGFPRYIREQRVTEAKRLLIDEPGSSVLAISMETGFKSQSNFYTAFKDITGVSPGQFRKKNS